MRGTPVRSCLVCRRRAVKQSLVRVTALRDVAREDPGASDLVDGGPRAGSVVVDPGARRPGRGAYLCDRPECVDAALAKGGARLARALRLREGEVTVREEAVRAGWRATVQGPRAAQDVPS